MAASGQGHEMSSHHRNILISNQIYLLENVLCGEYFLGHMIQSKLINQDILEEIQACTNRTKKVTYLLGVLPRRGPEAFRKFLHALIDSEQGFIAEKLDKDFYLSITLKKQCTLQSNDHEPISSQNKSPHTNHNANLYDSSSVDEVDGQSEVDINISPLKKITNDWIRSACFLPDGSIAYIMTFQSTVQTISTTGDAISYDPTPGFMDNTIQPWDISGNSEIIAVINKNNSQILVYQKDNKGWDLVGDFTTNDTPYMVVVSPNKNNNLYLLLNQGSSFYLCKYDKTGQPIMRTVIEAANVSCIAIGRNENCFLLENRTIYKYNTRGEKRETIKIQTPPCIETDDEETVLAVHDAGCFIIGYRRGQVILYSQQGEYIMILICLDDCPASVAVDPQFGVVFGTEGGLYTAIMSQ